MLLDNTQAIRGMVKTPATQLVRKGLARPGLMGLGARFMRVDLEEMTDASMPARLYSGSPTPLVTRRGGATFFSDMTDKKVARIRAGGRGRIVDFEELTDAKVPARLFSQGLTPLVTRRSGLGDFTDASSPTGTSSDVSTIMTAVNSEAGFLTNLFRGIQGKPPLPTGVTAPTVNVGLNLESLRPLAVPAALALGAWFFLGRRRRR